MITGQAEMRELIALDGFGDVLRGTYHQAMDTVRNEPCSSDGNIAVVFLNSLSSPRSLIGDSAVYWATALAACGYPCFRFDLPGLGDSEGPRPNDLIRFTNEGGYAAAASFLIKELVRSRGLSGVIIFGHCAGATTAIYAASECSACKGLILMDPYCNLPKAITSSLSPKLVNWARGSRLGAVARATYDRVRELRGAFGSGTLPANANFKLIARYKQVASTGLPMLILQAAKPPALGTRAHQAGTFDYLAHVTSFAVYRDQFTVTTVENTDHSFANLAGRAAVLQHAEAWLTRRFPTAEAGAMLRQTQDRLHPNPEPLGTAISAHVSHGE